MSHCSGRRCATTKDRTAGGRCCVKAFRKRACATAVHVLQANTAMTLLSLLLLSLAAVAFACRTVSPVRPRESTLRGRLLSESAPRFASPLRSTAVKRGLVLAAHRRDALCMINIPWDRVFVYQGYVCK